MYLLINNLTTSIFFYWNVVNYHRLVISAVVVLQHGHLAVFLRDSSVDRCVMKQDEQNVGPHGDVH